MEFSFVYNINLLRYQINQFLICLHHYANMQAKIANLN